jgi:hypothetical protein
VPPGPAFASLSLRQRQQVTCAGLAGPWHGLERLTSGALTGGLILVTAVHCWQWCAHAHRLPCTAHIPSSKRVLSHADHGVPTGHGMLLATIPHVACVAPPAAGPYPTRPPTERVGALGLCGQHRREQFAAVKGGCPKRVTSWECSRIWGPTGGDVLGWRAKTAGCATPPSPPSCAARICHCGQ